jgi:hypothetical protein
MTHRQRSVLFGEVNDRIYDLLESAGPDVPGEFLCECGRDCGRRVTLTPAEFAALREAGEIVRSSECGKTNLGQHDDRAPAAGVPALS